MSDVRRGRAVLVAALAAALGLAAVLLASDGAGRVLSPPAVSVPHQKAGLECKSCHQAESTAQACVGCHGAQRSARPGHQRLAARGELGCGDCHRAHGAEGVRAEQGALFHFTAQGEWAHDPAGALFAGSALPLIAAERCSACHDAERDSDPAAHCFSSTAASNLCFDEHAGRARPGRSGLVEAARSVAQSEVARARKPSLARIAWQLLGAFGFGLVALFVVRRRGRVSAAKPGEAAANEPVAQRRRLPVIDAARCLGCAACVEACPHDVLEVSRHVALVARPDACCGLALCAERCPNGSLILSEGESAPELPRFSSELESLSEPGVFLAGDVTGQALIRTALQQGARAARAVQRSLAKERSSGDVHDLAIIGAGPAGLSAALEAKKLGLRAVVLEQGRIAESIQSFSRDKIVLDSSAPGEELPLWIGECHKDELVRRWLRTVRSQKLDLRQHARVLGWHRRPGNGVFEIRCADAEGAPLLVRRVLLAIGRRGSPRKLEVPIAERAEAHVHYSLSDARSFAGRRVVVVGLGDSAMEAVLALAQQSGTSVDVVYRGSDHRRGKRRNIAEFRRLCDAGRVCVHWSAEVTRITAGEIAFVSDGAERVLPCDALFVMIGGEGSDELLPS